MDSAVKEKTLDGVRDMIVATAANFKGPGILGV